MGRTSQRDRRRPHRLVHPSGEVGPRDVCENETGRGVLGTRRHPPARPAGALLEEDRGRRDVLDAEVLEHCDRGRELLA